MTIYNVLSLIGGLALFLFGMNVMGQSLEKAAGKKLKNILAGMTQSPLRALLLGFMVTAVIQSSSATTVMVVGFVNSGLMQLGQAIGVIMGANIGTTVTAWLLSLTGISGESLLINLLKPSSFTPVLALIGIILMMIPKKGNRREIGTVLLGFAVLMTGMEMMSAAVKPLATSEKFTNLFLLFKNPLLGVLAGALLTGVIQSSSASVGILQALSATGSVTFAAAIPIIMGQNIGTCVTALISSVGTNKNARRTALVHLYFNIIGTVICLIAFTLAKSLLTIPLLGQSIDAFGIAVVHSLFNVACTVILYPMRGFIEKLAVRSVRDTKVDTPFSVLDERLLLTPAIAAERCRMLISEMAVRVEGNFLLSISLLAEPNAKVFEDVNIEEEKIDAYEDNLSTYLVKLSTCRLSDGDSRSISQWLHTINDLERIGDHAVNIAERAQIMAQDDIRFSPGAVDELRVVTDALTEIITSTSRAFRNEDIAEAKLVEPLEQRIDDLTLQIKENHIKRLRAGECSIETGFAFDEIVTDFERVSDHCSNIAACQLAMTHENMDMHAYLSTVKSYENPEFISNYQKFQAKYQIQ